MKIDAVITWVDGNDPVHRQKRNRLASPDMLKADDVAGDTRFVEVGEIAWCVASINRYAPWINKIYIVTDAQDPHLEEFMERNFPEGISLWKLSIIRSYSEDLRSICRHSMPVRSNR